MTPEEFIFWLRGVSDTVTCHPYEETWRKITEKLSEVETDSRPYRIIPEILDPPIPVNPIKLPPSPGNPPEIIC